MANIEKSEIYFAGVSEIVIQNVIKRVGFSQGALPFRYLGVPLEAKKLSYQMCKPLLERVTSRLHSWTSKFLSYAGRLRLIQSVAEVMVAFWSQVFLLPKKLIKQVEAKCRGFLWSGSDGPSKKAWVA